MRIVTLLMVAASLVQAAAGHAQTNLALVPSVSVSAVSDDNVFSTAHRSSDQTMLFTPGVEGELATPRTSLLGSYAFDMLRAANFAALNNLEARRHGRIRAAYHQTSRLTFEATSYYDRSDDAGELNFETGVLLPRTQATRWEVGPSFTYTASPLVTVHGSYDWVRESLEHEMVGDEHVGRIVISRQLSERASISAGYIGRHFVNGSNVETSNATVAGTTYKLGPFTMLSLLAGPRISSDGRIAPEIAASLVRHSSSLLGYALDCWRGESIILGIVGPVEVTSMTGRAAWPLRRSIEIGGATGYFRSESELQGQARVYHAEAIAAWSPRPLYTVAATYGTDFQRGDIRTSLLNGQDVVRRVFQVKLTVVPRFGGTLRHPQPIESLAGAPKGANRD
jgi:hypothetical protein